MIIDNLNKKGDSYLLKKWEIRSEQQLRLKVSNLSRLLHTFSQQVVYKRDLLYFDIQP